MKKYFVIQVFVFLMLINCPMQAQLQFASHTIAGGEFAPVDPGSILAVDLDKDGDIDILSSGNNDNRLAWYENDGNENFYSHIITYGVPNCASIFACDLDSDGDIDILSASDKIDWFENDGQQNFQTHTLSTFYASTKQFGCVYAIDLDNDGDMDVLSVSDKINWYENYGTKHFGTHLISAEVYNAQCVYAADVDNDGDIDVLCASSESYPTYPAKVAWYENDSNQNFKEHTIVKGTGNVFSVVAADIDSDGDTDIISTFSGPYNDKFCWFENDSHQNFSAHAIDDSAWGANFACAVDMDGDMDLDILLAAYQNKIAWFENDGNANYIEHKISESLSVQSVFPVDIDGDGDMDVIAGVSSWEFSNHEILWFENGGSEKFNCQSILSSPGFIGSFYITDLDNDGRDDVLTDYFFSYHVNFQF